MSGWKHETHVRGGKARWAPPSDWRAKYGSVPIGDPMRPTFLKERRELCSGCSHEPHAAYECRELHLFTKKPCGCSVGSRV